MKNAKFNKTPRWMHTMFPDLLIAKRKESLYQTDSSETPKFGIYDFIQL